METTVIPLCITMDVIFIGTALLLLTMTQTVHFLFTSVGWHKLASIGWNG